MPKNIFNIPSCFPFSDLLAEGVLSRYGDNPLDLANITILLPNRRSCSALRESFLRINQGRPMLLPQMQPIGDISDEGSIIKMSSSIDLPPVISATKTQLLLTTLIEKWQKSLQTGEKINVAQAAHLAIELAAFLNEVEREQLLFEDLSEIVPDELSKHWQITLGFLTILIELWPNILEENGLISASKQRNMALDLQSRYWQKNPPAHPIIAAGSTGSVPATSNLLKTISILENGSIILPGLDCELDKKSWDNINEFHPQYALKNLLENIDVERIDIKSWLQKDLPVIDRVSLVREIMRPSATCDKWNDLDGNAINLEGLTRIDAPTLQDEAVIIALMMRRQLGQKGKTAMLVTNEKALSRRVISIMDRWDIKLDDSSGVELSSVNQAVFLRLLAKMIEDKATGVSLLSLLKHPFAACGYNITEFRNNSRSFEKAALRGIRSSDSFKWFYKKLAGNSKLISWLQDIEQIVKPFFDLMDKKEVSLAEMIRIHIKCAEKFASCDRINGTEKLWKADRGESLKEFIDELLLSAQGFKAIEPNSYAGLFEALLVGQKFRPKYGMHPRLSILSPIEARMQRADLVILGSLNEGSWPAATKADPWMSRPMRSNFGLSLPEKMIGLAAHDFSQAICAPNVVITRCDKSGGTQTIPSRWLLRLDIILDSLGKKEAINPKENWHSWAKKLNMPDQVQNCDQPSPIPAVHTRPKELYVTSIEKLMGDPYSVYAAKILKLKKLDELDQDPGAAEFGNFIHKSLEIFSKKYDEIIAGTEEIFLLECGKEALKGNEFPPSVISFWWPRFERIAGWIVETEKKRRVNLRGIISEKEGEYKSGDFTLKARADRIEINNDGEITIIDYKTGTVPTQKEVKLGILPQIALEGLIASEGGFEANGTVEELSFWKLSGGEKIAEEKPVKSDLKQLIDEAEKGLVKLITEFNKAETPYISCPNSEKAPRYNDYEHLARIKEWE